MNEMQRLDYPFVPACDVKDRKRRLLEEGFDVYTIDAASDSHSFFELAKDNLPLDPPISGKVNWDALRDSLYGGIDALHTGKVAIVIEDASLFKINDRYSFDIAIACLTGAVSEVERDIILDGRREAKVVVMVGVS